MASLNVSFKKSGHSQSLVQHSDAAPMLEPLESRLLLSLLGVGDDIVLPYIPYDGGGTMAYTAHDGAFNADALPVNLRYLNAGGTVSSARISGVVDNTRDFALRIFLDPQGHVAGGIAGDDLVVKGVVSADLNRDGANESYSGILLTGEIIAFGWLDPGTQDQYDFLLIPTGGTLMSYFQDKYIGLTMNSFYNSTFNGLFTENFGGGQVQGNIGPVDKPTVAGTVFFDANNNGINDGEAGIPGVSIALTGTDVNGNAVSQTVTTGADGAYVFDGNLLPGTYSITETQPEGYDLGGSNVFSNVVIQSSQHAHPFDFADLKSVSVSGRVFLDANNNGTDDAEAGIGGVTVTLAGGSLDSPLTTTTAADGSYSFAGLLPGTYALTESQPSGYITSAGSSDTYADIALASGQSAAGLSFGEIRPASLSGFVWVDFNNDGEIDFNEKAIAGVTITLTGTDDLGQSVTAVTQSDEDGVYEFLGLRPGDYSIMETQPAGFEDGIDALGTAGGLVGEDVFSQIQLSQGQDAVNYNFGERPLAGSAVTSGQTATIGFWQNKNGQALLRMFDRKLGDWLAKTLPNMYSHLWGKTGTEIAAIYQGIFSSKIKTPGPAKVDCQVMAVAFAAFVTSSDLAGTAATKYGFTVTQYGVGIATFNVGLSGLAFGVSNYSILTVLEILLATNEQSSDNVVYSNDAMLRALANTVYTSINEAGDIG